MLTSRCFAAISSDECPASTLENTSNASAACASTMLAATAREPSLPDSATRRPSLVLDETLVDQAIAVLKPALGVAVEGRRTIGVERSLLASRCA